MLNDDLYKAAVLAATDREDRGSGVHPSELDCTRRAVFSLMDVPKRTARRTFANQLLLDQAKAVHAMIQGELERGIPGVVAGARFTPEVEINFETNPRASEFLILGHTDGLFNWPDGDELLEIKTVSDEEKLKAVKTPRASYIRQANVYMYCLDIHKLTFLYAARTNPDLRRYFPVVFDPSIWEGIAKSIRLAIESSVEGRLPPVVVDAYTCRLCPWSYTCKKKGEWVDASSLVA